MTTRPRHSKTSAAPERENDSASDRTERVLIRQALSKWSSGDFGGCLLGLDEIGIGRHTSESILLRARALLRLQRAQDAKNWLSMMESQHNGDDAMATHAMLLGSAFSQLGQFDRAAELFETVRRSTPHPTIVVETAYYQALSLWQARDYAAARAVLSPAISSQQDIVTARALQLLGFIDIAQQNFAAAHRHFEAALQALIVCRARDKHLEATLLHVLSIGQAEVQGRESAWLDRLAHEFDWTESLISEHAQTLRHIGLAYARTNQPDSALDRFLEAASVQPDSPWAILGFTEAADLCRRLGEPVSAGGYFRTCTRVADGLCWDDVTGEARLALLHLAAAVARYGDGPRARRYLDLYYGRDRRGARLPALSALNYDCRLQSFERHTEALVHGALAIDDAVPMLADVANDWRRLDYRSRSDEARDDIRALTHRSYDVRCAAERFDSDAACPPTLRDGAGGEAFTAAKTIVVTAQQDRIVRRLVRGETIAQIAQHLALEPKTVRNHLARVYALFEVAGQSQLIVTILRDTELRKTFIG